jgi:hypothetical protein
MEIAMILPVLFVAMKFSPHSYDISDMRPGRSLDKTPGKTLRGENLGERVSSYRNHFIVVGRPRFRRSGAGSSPALRSYSSTSVPASKFVAGSQESSAGENPFHRT